MRTPVGVCLGACALCFAGLVGADTLYHCKAYTGGLFWSRNHCQQHGALVHRVAQVPDGLPFSTQVRLAEQAPGSQTGTNTAETRKAQKATTAASQKALKHQARCDKLRDQIAHQDSMARLARTGREQDRTADRKRRHQAAYDKAGC